MAYVQLFVLLVTQFLCRADDVLVSYLHIV